MVPLNPTESPAIGDPPTTAVDAPARNLAEPGRDVRVSPSPGCTTVAAPSVTAAAVYSGTGRVLLGVQRGTRTPGSERVPVRGDMTDSGAISPAVTCSPIRVSAFMAAGTAGPPCAETAADDRDTNADNNNGDERDNEAGQRERLALKRLAEAAAGEFRQQRDRHSALRLLTAWRCAAVRERSKREALSRLVRDGRKRRLGGGFALWRAGARLARTKEERRTAREGAVAAAAATKEAAEAAAKAIAAAGAARAERAAAEKLVREKEKELQHEKTAREELLKTVEKLQAKVCVVVMHGHVPGHGRGFKMLSFLWCP